MGIQSILLKICWEGIRDLGKVSVYFFDFLKMFEYFFRILSNTLGYFGILWNTSGYFEILCGLPMKKMEYQRVFVFTSG